MPFSIATFSHLKIHYTAQLCLAKACGDHQDDVDEEHLDLALLEEALQGHFAEAMTAGIYFNNIVIDTAYGLTRIQAAPLLPG